jgi:hypothetical protein
VFSCGWHITRDGQDAYSWKLKAIMKVFGPLARLARFADLDDQVEACRRVFASDTRWTVVRGSDLEEGDSQGLPVWSLHVGDPILASNITRRVDFALFMVQALENHELVHDGPGDDPTPTGQRTRSPISLQCGRDRAAERRTARGLRRRRTRELAEQSDVGGARIPELHAIARSARLPGPQQPRRVPTPSLRPSRKWASDSGRRVGPGVRQNPGPSPRDGTFAKPWLVRFARRSPQTSPRMPAMTARVQLS